MSVEDTDWFDDPCLAPPFAVLDYGESATIVDAEGRTFMFEHRAKGFVEELCKVLNENAERLVKSWRESVKKAKKAKQEKKRRKSR